MAQYDTDYEDLNQPPKRAGLSSMSQASDASIPGQPSVPGMSRTVSRESNGASGQWDASPTVEPVVRNPGSPFNDQSLIRPAAQDPFAPRPALTGRGATGTWAETAQPPGAMGGDRASFEQRMAARQAQRDAAYGASPAGRDAETQRVDGIYAREAAIRGLDGSSDPLARLNERPHAAAIGNPDTAGMRDFQRFSAQTDLSSMIHDLRTKGSTRALQAAGQLAAVQQAGFNAPEDQALRRAALAQQGDIAYRGQDAAALEADSRTKSVMALGRMKDTTDRRGQDITSALGLQRDATDRRGQDITERGQNLTYGASLAKVGQERYNSLLKGLDDYFVTTDGDGKATLDPAAKAAFLRQAGSDGSLAAVAQLPVDKQGPAMAKLLGQYDLQAARATADPAAPATNQPLRLERGSDSIGPLDVMREPGLGIGDLWRGISPFNNSPGGYGYVSTPADPTTGTQASRVAVPIAGLNADQRQVAEWLNRRGK